MRKSLCAIGVLLLGSCVGSTCLSFSSCAHAETNYGRSENAAAAVQVILQAVIDDAELSKFFHPELPSRRPLRVLKNEFVPTDARLVKFGVPVVVESSVRKGDAVLEFRRVDVRNEKATVEVFYKIEGLRGVFDLRKVEDKWMVDSRTLRESLKRSR